MAPSHAPPSSSTRPSSSNRQRDDERSREREKFREKLKSTAQETTLTLPLILNKLQRAEDARKYQKCTLANLPRLHPDDCPSYPHLATIRVINEDTLNAAIDLLSQRHALSLTSSTSSGANPLPAVVNFANRHSPGGGWLKGALAQEEGLCYRSSLSLSLNPAEYPLGSNDALYSPYVVVVRTALADGHRLLHHPGGVPVQDLPVVSVLTIAAINQPETISYTVTRRRVTAATKGGAGGGGGGGGGGGLLPPTKRMFAHNRERNLTKDKMRLVLRMAASNGHSMLVLGALGCGVFGNPPEDVAHCWLEVLTEDEFSGGWWRDVVFAVYDPKDEGNYEVFKAVLRGREV